jgi:Fuc2NAc and GlcNAc transferase
MLYQASDLTAVFPSLPPWLAGAVAALSMVWLLNLYNFMDGIDGIAGIEAITVCLGGALIFAESGSELWLAPVLLLGSVAGFLFWNFPSARIFMGDAGSGFLGYVLGLFCLQAASISSESFWAWVILLGVFVVDSTVALFRRLLRGRRIYVAHHSHAYQHAARRYGAHAPVSLSVGAINLLWLLPISTLRSGVGGKVGPAGARS